MDFTTIWNAVQPETISIVTCVTVGVAAYLYQWGVQRLPTNMRAHVQDMAQTAVQAIEQKYKDSSPGGAIKKQEAMQMVLSLADSLKLPIDVAHASAAIEAAVFALDLFGGKSTTPPQTPVPEKPTVPVPSVPAKSSAGKPLAAG